MQIEQETYRLEELQRIQLPADAQLLSINGRRHNREGFMDLFYTTANSNGSEGEYELLLLGTYIKSDHKLVNYTFLGALQIPDREVGAAPDTYHVWYKRIR